jgi:transposase
LGKEGVAAAAFLRFAVFRVLREMETAMTVAITRQELDANGLRREAARCDDASAARRMLALALVLEGASRSEAARFAGMDRQTLRDWVHRYNAEGLAGLRDRPHPGPSSRLSPEQLSELTAIVEAGPHPDEDKVIRWRRVDLQKVIAQRFKVDLHERSVGKILRKLNFRKMTVRPQHPNSKPDVQETFKKTFRAI